MISFSRHEIKYPYFLLYPLPWAKYSEIFIIMNRKIREGKSVTFKKKDPLKMFSLGLLKIYIQNNFLFPQSIVNERKLYVIDLNQNLVKIITI